MPKKIPMQLKSLPKTPTGITGFDEITGGGLPSGRPTLLCGAAGCGKTLFAICPSRLCDRQDQGETRGARHN
jgi:predicted ATP-dependent serine protease